MQFLLELCVILNRPVWVFHKEKYIRECIYLYQINFVDINIIQII